MRILLLGLKSGRLGQYKAVNRASVNVTVLDHKLRLLLGALQRDENKTTFDAQESMVSLSRCSRVKLWVQSGKL